MPRVCGDPECTICTNEEEPQLQRWQERLEEATVTLDNTTNITSRGEQMPRNLEGVPFPELPEDFYASDLNFTTAAGNIINSDGVVRVGDFVQIPVWDISRDRLQKVYTLLNNWLEENNLDVVGNSREYIYEEEMSATIPYYFSFIERGSVPGEPLSQPNCQCGNELVYPTIVCPDCRATQYCDPCGKFGGNVVWDESFGGYCDNCCVVCENSECSTDKYHRSNPGCPNCNPMVRCRGCHEYISRDGDETNSIVVEAAQDQVTSVPEIENNPPTYFYCQSCYANMCRSCLLIQEEGHIIEDEEGNPICVTCLSKAAHEEWDENSSLENDKLTIPTIPGRETIRLVGVEIEGANGDDTALQGRRGGDILARALYDNGLSSQYEMGSYHSGSRRNIVHVERDSSVDWEVVIGPLNVARSNDVDILNRSVKVVRGFINDKTLKLDMRAGLHIHVGADRVPFHSAYNLHKLYMYMEDFLYRFGAAKWPYHRSITRVGRDQAGKSPNTEGKLNFARTFAGQRYYGLSFDNYFARYFEECSCGARTYGLFDECTCDLGKCTFEFRLFNTTANTIKLHAYLAMCQALVAKAIEMDEIKVASEYPALDFIKERASDMHNSRLRKMNREWQKRITFVNEQLPLTQEEKKSIHYCIMNSEMGKTVENADILLETEDN